jgi:hypothetical protein
MNRLRTLIALPAVAVGLSGCNTMLVNDRPSLQDSHVKPVLTEHSLALACLGDLIDQSNAPQLTVYVRPIFDQTVPRRFEKRRLSLGGEWWLHTAINKIGSDRVVSVTSQKAARNTANHIEISGAWTQDDFAVGERNAELEAERAGSVTDFDFFAGSRRSVDVIAGDFLTVRNKRVIHATAISLAIGAQRDGFGLRIQDATYDVALDLSTSVNEGPQFAQRRIAEAAALVHVSRAFDIDYRPCIELGWANSTAYQSVLKDYLSESVADRNRRVQVALKDAGYDPGAPDGIWGRRSVSAMMRFQNDRGLPVTGRPSAELYLSLLQHSKSTSSEGVEG